MADANQPAPPAQDDQPVGNDKEVIVGKYKIKVLRDACIGAASCVST
jgi:hypothetical protein